jgi:hypothetical protein
VCGWRRVETPLGWGKSRVQFQSQASSTPLTIYIRVNLEVMKVPKELETIKFSIKVHPNVFSFTVLLELKIGSKKQGIKEGHQVPQGIFFEKKTRCIIHNGLTLI